MKLLPNLYFLRFILALSVVFLHLRLLSEACDLPYYRSSALFYKGLIAVYYFFTLSGFLIIRLIYNQINSEHSFSIKDFYLRRIQRIYPVYYLVIIIGLLVYHVLYPLLDMHGDFDYKISDLLFYYITFRPNVFTVINPDTGKILLILWSIGIEEQFYLAIPWLLILFKKHTIKLLLFLLSISIAVMFFFPSFYSYNNYYFYFLAGGLISIVNIRKKNKIFKSIFLHIPVYFIFLLTFFTSFFTFTSFYSFHLFHLFTSAILIGLLADYPLFIIKSKLINYLGQISYGIYMYHVIVITGLVILVKQTNIHLAINEQLYILLFSVVAIAITLIISHLSFRYFERLFYKSKPFLKMGVA
jgi:peptidoglycan/LPS O-acetylase OafA/YrhL